MESTIVTAFTDGNGNLTGEYLPGDYSKHNCFRAGQMIVITRRAFSKMTTLRDKKDVYRDFNIAMITSMPYTIDEVIGNPNSPMKLDSFWK